MAFNLGSLAGLGGITQSSSLLARQQQEAERLKMDQALQAIAMQNQQQQQQGMNVAGDAFSQLPPQQPPMAPLQGGGAGVQGMPYGQNQSGVSPYAALGGGMASGLPAPGAVKGSWFGNSPGWQDPSDSGLQASGVPVAGHPGIALPSRASLGQQFDVTTPEGRTFTLPQTDVGPAKWTGRGVDINAPAAEAMGYTPKNFPTDKQFIVKAHNQLDSEVGQKGVAMMQQGAPVPAIQESTSTAKQAGREIDPQEWGRSSIEDIKAAINKVAPDAPGVVKLIAAGQLSKLLMPEEKLQMQMYFKDKQQQIQLQMKEMQLSQSQAGQAETARHNRAMEGLTGERLAQGAEAPARAALNKFLEEKPDATAEEIQSFIQRGRSARSGPAMAAQKYLQENPNASAEDIRNFVAQTAAQTSTVRQFDVGKQGDTVRSLNVAIDHLAVLSDAGQALGSGDVQKLNQLNNYISKELGQPAVTDFNSVKAIVKDELVKAVLGGVGALGDRQEVEKTIDAASSPQQLQGVIKRYEQLMGGQMKGLKQQFTTSGGGGESDFDKKLLPRVREVIKRAGSPAEQQGGQQIPPVTEEQYNALPSGSVYTMPGDPTPRYKP